MFALALLGSTFGAISLMAGSATGKMSLAIGIAAAVGVLAYVFNSFAQLVAAIEWLRYVSPIYYYSGADPLANGLSLAHVAVLLSTIVGLVIASAVLFERRDIAV
jgi:ABC-2 type transport system permease protein